MKMRKVGYGIETSDERWCREGNFIFADEREAVWAAMRMFNIPIDEARKFFNETKWRRVPIYSA